LRGLDTCNGAGLYTQALNLAMLACFDAGFIEARPQRLDQPRGANLGYAGQPEAIIERPRQSGFALMYLA
jgi:hypothetical protein